MSDIARKKRDHKRQDAKFNHEGEFDLEKTIEERETRHILKRPRSASSRRATW